MFKAIRARYQAYWDRTPTPEPKVESTAQAPDFGASMAGKPDPYRQLGMYGAAPRGPVRQVRAYRVADPSQAHPAPSLATPAQRAYEANLPQWAREALAEMDQVVLGVIREELTEVRTPQYIRRTRRNITETMGELPELQSEEDIPAFIARMGQRARRASDPDITGLIPVMPAFESTEEAWA